MNAEQLARLDAIGDTIEHALRALEMAIMELNELRRDSMRTTPRQIPTPDRRAA